jgi:hypothetical protein
MSDNHDKKGCKYSYCIMLLMHGYQGNGHLSLYYSRADSWEFSSTNMVLELLQ